MKAMHDLTKRLCEIANENNFESITIESGEDSIVYEDDHFDPEIPGNPYIGFNQGKQYFLIWNSSKDAANVLDQRIDVQRLRKLLSMLADKIEKMIKKKVSKTKRRLRTFQVQIDDISRLSGVVA